jgi:hypothetical protein
MAISLQSLSLSGRLPDAINDQETTRSKVTHSNCLTSSHCNCAL